MCVCVWGGGGVGRWRGWKEVGTAREGFQLLTSSNQRLRSASNNAVLCISFTWKMDKTRVITLRGGFCIELYYEAILGKTSTLFL